MSISTQLAEYIKRESITVGAKNTPAVRVTYKRLDGEAPKEMSLNFLTGRLSEDSAEVFGKLKAGDKVVIVKEKQGEYWNFKEFKDASTWEDRPKKEWPPKPNGGQYSGNSYQKKEFDTVGIKVGAARNQSLAFLAATKGSKFTLDDVDSVAMEIVSRQAAQEALVRSGQNVAPTTEDNFTNDKQDDEDSIPF